MNYNFLVETYETEILKTVSAWSMFSDEDLKVRPRSDDFRGRSVHEQMVHQCMSEDLWFRTMLSIDLQSPILPESETRIEFIKQYARNARQRLKMLNDKDPEWWEEIVDFFEVKRSRAWIFTRRLNHSAYHRGQLTAILRMLGKQVYSTYGPTADTGGLPKNQAPTIYAYDNLDELIEAESREGNKVSLPGTGDKPVTERPD